MQPKLGGNLVIYQVRYVQLELLYTSCTGNYSYHEDHLKRVLDPGNGENEKPRHGPLGCALAAPWLYLGLRLGPSVAEAADAA